MILLEIEACFKLEKKKDLWNSATSFNFVEEVRRVLIASCYCRKKLTLTLMGIKITITKAFNMEKNKKKFTIIIV